MICPKCGSDNVLASCSGDTAKCFDCGYEDDIEEFDVEGQRAGYSRQAEADDDEEEMDGGLGEDLFEGW